MKFLMGGELVSTERAWQKEHAGVGYSASLKRCGSQKWQKYSISSRCLIKHRAGGLSVAARAFKLP